MSLSSSELRLLDLRDFRKCCQWNRDFPTVIASHRLGAKRRRVCEAIHSRVRCAMDCFVARAPRNDGEDPLDELRNTRKRAAPG